MSSAFAQHPPYIPVLKWQRGEQRAINNLFPLTKERVWPCIDVRMPDQHNDFLAKFINSWNRSALVDYANPQGYLTDWRRASYVSTLLTGRQQNCPFVPVLNPMDASIARDAELLNLAKPYNRIAFRVRVEGMVLPPNIRAACGDLIRALAPYTGYIQLVIDHGATPPAVTDNACQTLVNELVALRLMGFWGISFISGAYPDMLPKNNGAVLEPPRADWALWQRLHLLQQDLRLGFGDYGILSPSWTEEVLQRRPNVSIRYADSQRWLIIRGTAKTSEESIAISKVLTTFYPAAFRGEAFSFGDRLISDRCNDDLPASRKKCGNEMHVSEGWNHHISLVVQEQYV